MTDTAAPYAAQLANWFPLVPRFRPHCGPLSTRVQHISDLAETNSHDMTTYTQALNLAALIVSDCGLPDRARSMCWNQFDLFTRRRPWDTAVAEAALEPLINLARLAIRDGEGHRAHTILQGLFDNVNGQTEELIDGHRLDLSPFVTRDDTKRHLRRQLWKTLLSDGTRALTRTGQWSAALDNLEQLNGVGTRLMDGRQVAVLAAYSNHDYAQAITLIEQSHTPTDWETAVSTCLRKLSHLADGLDDAAMDKSMVDAYLALEPGPGHIVFRTRLGLMLLGLVHDGPSQHVAHRIINDVLHTRDAYAAREANTHTTCREHLNTEQRKQLNHIITASGLHNQTIPAPLERRLTIAVESARQKLETILDDRTK